MPGNAEIYQAEFRKLVEFDSLKPERILGMINKDWSSAFLFNKTMETI
jgi:hypothetical protein